MPRVKSTPKKNTRPSSRSLSRPRLDAAAATDIPNFSRYSGRGVYSERSRRRPVAPVSTSSFWDRIRSSAERTSMGLEDDNIPVLLYGAINIRRRELLSRMGYSPADISRLLATMSYRELGNFLSSELYRLGIPVPSWLQARDGEQTRERGRREHFRSEPVRRRFSDMSPRSDDDDDYDSPENVRHRLWQYEQENP